MYRACPWRSCSPASSAAPLTQSSSWRTTDETAWTPDRDRRTLPRAPPPILEPRRHRHGGAGVGGLRISARRALGRELGPARRRHHFRRHQVDHPPLVSLARLSAKGDRPMSFKERMNDRTTIMRLGMSCLIVFSLLLFLHPTTDRSFDVLDGVRGLFLGLSIGFNLWSVRLTRARRCTPGRSDDGES